MERSRQVSITVALRVTVVSALTLLPAMTCLGVALMAVEAAASSSSSSSQSLGRASISTGLNPANSAESSSDVIVRLLHNYNNQEPPMKDRPTEVQLGIYVNSFYSISEQTMDYSVSMYLRQSWRDPRLVFRPIQRKILQVRLGEVSISHVWIPDTFFRNEKRATFHEVTVNNRLMRLNATGFIWYVTKISATLSCPMKLQKFPLDTQSCPMMFESFGYTMDTLHFSWLENPVDIEKNMQLPQFTLEGFSKRDCSQNYTAGAFPCLEIRFTLRRDLGYFLIQIYVPSMLIVILSWVSFWINVDASPARVSIGLLTVLTTTTQSTGVNGQLPRVSYIKAVDVWMSACLVFVFAALLEYAVVNVLSRRRGGRTNGANGGFLGSLPPLAATGLPLGPPPSGGCGSSVVGMCTATAAGVSGDGILAGCRRQQAPPGSLSLLHPIKKLETEARYDQVNAVVVGINRRQQQQQQQALQREAEAAEAEMAGRPPPPSPTNNGPMRTGAGGIISTAAGGVCIIGDGKWRARRVDKVSRTCFPLVFLLFNIIYWIVYTLPDDPDEEY